MVVGIGINWGYFITLIFAFLLPSRRADKFAIIGPPGRFAPSAGTNVTPAPQTCLRSMIVTAVVTASRRSSLQDSRVS